MRSLVAATIVGAFVSLFAALARLGTDPSHAPQTAVASPCKTYGDGPCCDPGLARRLPKEAVFAACAQSEATFLGEEARGDGCRCAFRVASEDAFVQVHVSPAPLRPSIKVDASTRVCNQAQTARLTRRAK